mmetsp:Transcript_32673/g.70535  ORF Transcript_32673/g.70535 Transcript_32673/m.70535 type:complete len:231 (-) Transcript_32673:366-1058(-)
MQRRSRNVLQNSIQQSPHARYALVLHLLLPTPLRNLQRRIDILGNPPPPRAAEQRPIFHLLRRRIQALEQIHQIQFGLASLQPPQALQPIGLVEDHDRHESQRQRPRQDVLRLGLGTLAGVHHQDDAVDRGEDAVHLSREVGVSRRVDHVDDVGFATEIGVGGGVVQSRDLGGDGDAAFLFEFSGIHETVRFEFFVCCCVVGIIVVGSVGFAIVVVVVVGLGGGGGGNLE